MENPYNTNNGLVASMLCTNTGVQAEYDYDLLDRIRYITWKDSWGATILSFDYLYNAAGMITNVIKNGGSPVSYQYDDLDRLTGVETESGLVEYGYDFAGNRQTKTGADYTVDYTLGDGNRFASWTAQSTNNFESFRTLEVQGHSSENIGTDDRWGQLYVSNSVAITPDISGTNFWVDGFVTGLGTQKVVAAIRDQAGNVGYATNEFFLSVVTNAAYSYSAAGCLTNVAYSGTEYNDCKGLEWNAQYQLVSVTSVSSVVNYSYDVLGRRSSRTVAGGGDPGSTNTEFYVYVGNQVVADLNENGNVLRSYTWGPGIDNLLAFTDHATRNTCYALKDIQNSVMALVDESGSVVESYEYDAWGKVLSIKDSFGNVLSQSAIGNRYFWQGREYDAVTGLYYFRARWFDPVLGRFILKDPIGISGGLNQYVFCLNNPVNIIDPFGFSGTLTIHSDRGDDGLMSGHSWISYQPDDGNLAHTYSTWRGNAGMEDRPGEATRQGVSTSKHLDDVQEKVLMSAIAGVEKKGLASWGWLSPCSAFASDMWNITGGNIRDRTWFGISNPNTLADSIDKINRSKSISGTSCNSSSSR